MKNIKKIIVFLLCFGCFVGCDTTDIKNEPVQNNEITSDVEEPAQPAGKTVSQSDLRDVSGWSEVNSYTGDVDGDGEEEKVVLMTSSQRNYKNEIVWNDGQEWILYVKDADGYYVLVDEYIQIGTVYFEVRDYYISNGVVPQINVIITGGAGFNMSSYSFSNEGKVYVEDRVYDTSTVTEGGTSLRFSSFPEIK